MTFDFIPAAHAEATSTSGGTAVPAGVGSVAASGSPMVDLIPFLFIIVIFYFLLIRPQQKKMKEHQKLVESVKKNDKVLTAGGIVGTVVRVPSDSKVIEVTIAPGVDVMVLRSTITEIVDASGNSLAAMSKKEHKDKDHKKDKGHK